MDTLVHQSSITSNVYSIQVNMETPSMVMVDVMLMVMDGDTMLDMDMVEAQEIKSTPTEVSLIMLWVLAGIPSEASLDQRIFCY